MANQDTPFIHRQSPSEVVSLAEARRARERLIEAKWQRFVAASLRSKETLAIADGIAAAKAYSDFVRFFVRNEEGRQ